MAAGQRSTYVTLRQVVAAEHATVVYDPPGLWVEFRPTGPTAFDEEKMQHLLETDFHPQMTVNTILVLDDGRVLYVRGITDRANRHAIHDLLCEEVLSR